MIEKHLTKETIIRILTVILQYFCLLVVLFVIIVIVCLKMSQLCDRPGYKTYEVQYTLNNGYSFTSIQVCEMKDKELEKKINNSLNSCFYILVPPWFEEGSTVAYEPIIHLQSARYLSIEYIFRYWPVESKYWYMCVTVNIENGELVYLDDLINLDEDFALLIKNGAVLNCDKKENNYIGEATEDWENIYFSKSDVSCIIYHFKSFRREELYGEHYWKAGYEMYDFAPDIYSRFFYLEEGKVCFPRISSTSAFSVSWIMTEDIEEHLKVPKW